MRDRIFRPFDSTTVEHTQLKGLNEFKTEFNLDDRSPNQDPNSEYGAELSNKTPCFSVYFISYHLNKSQQLNSRSVKYRIKNVASCYMAKKNMNLGDYSLSVILIQVNL